MSGAGAIIAFLILRAVIEATRGQTNAPAAPKRVSTHPWYLGLLWFGVIALLFGWIALGATLCARLDWWSSTWPLPVSAFVVLLFPHTVARCVFVPLGCPRIAYHLAVLSITGETYDLRGNAALLAAFALLARRRPSPEGAARVEARIHRDRPMRGAGAVAIGVLALVRGDRDEARRLFDGVLDCDPRVTPPGAAKLAADWLAADAASRGEWRRVRWIARRGPHPTSRRTRFLGRAASAILRLPDAPGRFALVVRWLFTPSRPRMWPLLVRACARIAAAAPSSEPRRPEERPTTPSDAPMPRPIDRALLAHEALLRRVRPRKADLCAVEAAWRTSLRRRETLAWAVVRAVVIGATDGEAIVRGMERTVADELAAALRRSAARFMSFTRREGPLGTAARQVRDDLMSDLTLACQAVSARVEQKRALPIAEEWREWQALREAADRDIRTGGPTFQRLAFPTLHGPVTSLACWLYNVRGERSIANAIFRWLHRQACAAEDVEAKALQLKNMNCGL